jgi:hypothetical protein
VGGGGTRGGQSQSQSQSQGRGATPTHHQVSENLAPRRPRYKPRRTHLIRSIDPAIRRFTNTANTVTGRPTEQIVGKLADWRAVGTFHFSKTQNCSTPPARHGPADSPQSPRAKFLALFRSLTPATGPAPGRHSPKLSAASGVVVPLWHGGARFSQMSWSSPAHLRIFASYVDP